MSILRTTLKSLDLKKFRLRSGKCPFCGTTIFLRLYDGEFGVRCLRCKSAPNTMAMVHALKDTYDDLSGLHAYVLSAGGPYFDFLQNNVGKLTCSLYFKDVPPGEFVNGVQCQDVQRLTYADASFDLCTSADVLEHVPDDIAAFAELYRVLRPGGFLIFTVPLVRKAETLERARIEGGQIVNLLPPDYHNDSIRGEKVLVFREFGEDIIERLTGIGFPVARIIDFGDFAGWGYSRPVIVARNEK